MTNQPTATSIKNATDKGLRSLYRNLLWGMGEPTNDQKLNMKLNRNLADGTIKIENPPSPEQLNAEQVANIMMIYRPVKVIREPKC